MYVPAFGKLETKNKDELLKIIRSTKQKLGWLRKKMEHPDYNNIDVIVSPSDLVVYKCERDYLNLAIAKYISLGGEYKESSNSIRDTKFNDGLENIAKIVFYNGGFFSTNLKTVIDLSEDKPKLFAGSFGEIYEQDIEIDKEEFLYQLGELHIHKFFTPCFIFFFRRSSLTTLRNWLIVFDILVSQTRIRETTKSLFV